MSPAPAQIAYTLGKLVPEKIKWSDIKKILTTKNKTLKEKIPKETPYLLKMMTNSNNVKIPNFSLKILCTVHFNSKAHIKDKEEPRVLHNHTLK